MKKDYTEIDKKAFELFKQGISLTKISKEFNIDRGNLSKRLKEKYDIKTIPCGRKYHCNDGAFSDIKTEQQAYWIGFLLADGCVRNDKNIIEVALAEKDKEHLNKLNLFLNSTYKITPRNTRSQKNGKSFLSYRTYFISKQICYDLSKYGCIENKTYKNSFFPSFNNEILDSACVRGFFDGDGSIGLINHDKNKIGRATITCYSKDILKQIYNILSKYINIKFIIYDSHNTRTPSLYFNKNDAMAVLHFLYDNSTIYLERKYNIFTKHIAVY